MKLHVLSDLHLEVANWPRQWCLDQVDADVTIMAGDIGVGLQGLDFAIAFERPVLYVLGNHEFYGQRPRSELLRKAHAKVSGSNVQLLENDVALLADPTRPGRQIRFLGATLWTDFAFYGLDCLEDSMRLAEREMNDYVKIDRSRFRRSGGSFTPNVVLGLHQESRMFLEAGLDQSKSSDCDRTVVITHHAPSARSIVGSPDHNSPLAASYVSHLDEMVSRADLWVHGHTHHVCEYSLPGQGEGRVVSNPRGYGPSSCPGFDPFRVVEI